MIDYYQFQLKPGLLRPGLLPPRVPSFYSLCGSVSDGDAVLSHRPIGFLVDMQRSELGDQGLGRCRLAEVVRFTIRKYIYPIILKKAINLSGNLL